MSYPRASYITIKNLICRRVIYIENMGKNNKEYS